MARRNRTLFCRGKQIVSSSDSYWGPSECLAFAKALKQHDPLMVVALYPTSYREALRLAVEAVGLRWRYVGSEELELIRELSRLKASA